MTTKEKVFNLLTQSKNQVISGEKLAVECNVSRAAIWKAVKSLRNEGFLIEGSTNGGYIFCGEMDVLNETTVKKFLISEYPKLKTSSVECFQTIDSTNTYAKKLLAENIASTLNKKIIVAESQTKGRGRLGRFFCSPEKTGIYLSIIYVPEYAMEGKNIDPAKITAFSAVAACRVIKKLYNVEPKIKWINDIYLNQKKIAGILTEGITNFETGCIEACVIGIGINIQHNEKSFPEDVAKIAGSIIGKENNSEQTKVSRAKFAAEIAGEILSIFDEKKENIMKEYKAASFLIGSIVNVYSLIGDDTSVYKAKVLEIDDNAGLVVELSNGTKKTLNSGEVTLHSN